MTNFKDTVCPPRVNNLTGQVFGRLTVLGFSHTDGCYSWWFCRCECGIERAVRRNSLASGRSKSCGCLALESLEKGRTKHGCTSGGKSTKEYQAWEGMINRCSRQKSKGWKHYGGRGITVCQRWRESFQAFLEDMGSVPTAKHSIDRINNDGNYEPGNCRWATRQDQARNTQRSRFIEIDGVTRTLAEWVEIAGATYNTVLYRIRRGWPEREAIFTPIASRKENGQI